MNRPKTINYKNYGKIHPLSIRIGFYYDNSLAVFTDTYENGYAEPWGNITVCLSEKLEPNCAFIDINNCPDIDDWLIENKIAEFTGRTKKSGFVTYPEFRFDPEVLKEFDPDGYENYINPTRL